jgi:phospholipase C
LGRFLKHPRVLIETAILVTFDESGGFYDSGFIQPVDVFGDGPRVPLLAISPGDQLEAFEAAVEFEAGLGGYRSLSWASPFKRESHAVEQ